MEAIDPDVRLAMDGDTDAISRLFRTYNERMTAMACRILRDGSQAEDATQTAWIKVIRGLPEFRGDAKFSTWVTRITMNEALMVARQRRPDTTFKEICERDAQTAPMDLTVLRDASFLLGQIRPIYAETAAMVYLKGMTVPEVAKALGITLSCAKGRVNRALVAMRRVVKR